MLTQDEIKKIFEYDLATGIFTRKETNNKKLKKGEVVGSLHKHGYLMTKINKKPYSLHRLAWLYVYGYIPKEIDHIDGVRSNNKINNLRETDRLGNTRNSKIRKDNKSGYKGVYFEKSNNKWRALCRANGKQNNLGCFETAIEASRAYENFARQNHGEFYRETQARRVQEGLIKCA